MPPPVAGAYIRSLPTTVLLQYGVEGLFRSSSTGSSPCHASTHICLEQIQANLCDFILQYVTNEQYRAIEKHLSLFEEIVLLSLYLVRSRTIGAVLLGSGRGVPDMRISLLAPGVDLLNHSAVPTAAVAVSPPQKVVVVRALNDIPSGSEITIHYTLQNGKLLSDPQEGEKWEARYLMGCRGV